MERKQKQLVNLNLDVDLVAMLDEMVKGRGKKCKRPAVIAPLIRQAYARFKRRQESDRLAAEMQAEIDALKTYPELVEAQKDGAQ